MRDTFIFGTLDKQRDQLLQLVEGCPENKRNIVHESFNNSVHWQIGHVLTITERLVFGLTEQTPAIPANYQIFFGSGTKPGDWQDEPPAWDLLMTLLKEQTNRIRKSLKDKLEVSMKVNSLKVETVGELVIINMLHEVNHAGTISAMLKVLK